MFIKVSALLSHQIRLVEFPAVETAQTLIINGPPEVQGVRGSQDVRSEPDVAAVVHGGGPDEVGHRGLGGLVGDGGQDPAKAGAVLEKHFFKSIFKINVLYYFVFAFFQSKYLTKAKKESLGPADCITTVLLMATSRFHVLISSGMLIRTGDNGSAA